MGRASRFAVIVDEEWCSNLRQRPILGRRLAEESLAEQRAVEAEPEMPFEAYLEAYFRD